MKKVLLVALTLGLTANAFASSCIDLNQARKAAKVFLENRIAENNAYYNDPNYVENPYNPPADKVLRKEEADKLINGVQARHSFYDNELLGYYSYVDHHSYYFEVWDLHVSCSGKVRLSLAYNGPEPTEWDN